MKEETQINELINLTENIYLILLVEEVHFLM